MIYLGAFETPGLPFESDGGFIFYQRMSKLNYWSAVNSIEKMWSGEFLRVIWYGLWWRCGFLNQKVLFDS